MDVKEKVAKWLRLGGASPSYERNLGEVSFTWQDSGQYGRFINRCRVAAWQLAIQSYSIPTERILDVGCSYGSWADNWRELGFRSLVGIEPNADVVGRARARFDEVHLGFSRDLLRYFRDEKCIAANGVLVHILEHEEAVQFLSDCAGVLAHDGWFLYSVINPEYYLSCGRKEMVGDKACVRPLETHRQYARAAGLEVVGEIGTFIDPWSLPELEFLAQRLDWRERPELYDPFIRLAALLRGETLTAFSEVLFVARRSRSPEASGRPSGAVGE